MSNSIKTSFTQSDQVLRDSLGKIQKSVTNGALNSAGLATGSSDASKIKLANTVYAIFDGVMVSKTTSEVALTTACNTTNDKFNVLLVSINSDGDITVTAGTEGATLGAVVLGTVPTDDAVLGFVIINPTGTGNFVGGTTDLDDATVVPGAVYVDTANHKLDGTGATTL